MFLCNRLSGNIASEEWRYEAIRLSQRLFEELKQENMSEEDVKFHLAKLNKPKLPQSQTRLEVKADGTTTDGIPSSNKLLGILPNEL
jgi:hypothetical protein